MSTTVGGLVDRVFREYLEPNDDVVSYTALTSQLTQGATTLSFNANLLTQEEEDVMDAGTIIECEQELMYCTAVDVVNNEVTIVRGFRGTTDVTHANGSIVKIAPPFTRKAVFDAISDQVTNLYPTLYAVDTQEVISGTGYTLLGTYDAPADYNYLVHPISAISQCS